jgi:hypothetical protein
VGVLNASAHLTSADECALQHIIDAEVLPGMQRGSKTQYVFDRFGIETDFAAFIVRGAGAKVLKQELGV